MLALALAIFVEGTTACPTADAVAKRLSEMSPSSSTASRTPDRALLEDAGELLQLELRAPDGHSLATRRIARPKDASCADLANAAAVILATWEAELRSPQLTAPQLRPPTMSLARPPRAEPSKGQWVFDVGFLGAVAEPGFAPGGRLDLWRWPAPRWGWHVLLGATALRTFSLGVGEGSYTHLIAGGGPAYRLLSGTWAVAVHAEVLGGVLYVGGSGFMMNRSEVDFDPGLSLGLRLAPAEKGLRPWLDLTGCIWPREQQATAGIAHAVLPRGELFLSVGLTFWGTS